jgi:hypothetical protein
MACGSTYVWKGLSSWFCCGNAWGVCGSAGTGACGTCQSSTAMAAWPNLTAACLSVTDPGACGENMPRHGCGSVLNVTNQCGATVCITLADCGPNTQEFCGSEECCNGQCRTNRIIDLTPSAFSAIGNLDSGILPVWIYE